MGVRVPTGFAEVIYRLKIVGDSEEMLTTLGVGMELGRPFVVADAIDLAGVFETTVMSVVSADCTFVGLHMRAGPDGLGASFTVDRNKVGMGTGPSLPPNVACLVQKRGNVGGRRNRGRSYIPGVPASLVNQAGVWAAAGRTSWQTAMTNWRAETAARAWVSEVVIFHSTPDKANFEGGPKVAQPAIAPTPVESVNVPNKVATQRRRLRP